MKPFSTLAQLSICFLAVFRECQSISTLNFQSSIKKPP